MSNQHIDIEAKHKQEHIQLLVESADKCAELSFKLFQISEQGYSDFVVIGNVATQLLQAEHELRKLIDKETKK